MDETRRDILKQFGFVLAAAPLVAAPNPVAAQSAAALTRSRNSLPKISKSPADLVASKLVLPVSKASAIRPDTLGSYTYKPGDYASLGLPPYMGSTGDRPELGLITEAQGQWLAGGSPNNMLAQAEAHGSVPIHATIDGRIIDHFKNPRASFDSRGGANPYFKMDGAAVTPDSAHYPALSYVAYLATNDLYYLEELQFAATYHVIGQPINYAGGKGLLWPWQQRQLAWGLRDIIAAYIATPEGDLPAPLLPKSYWKQILDNNIAALTARYINGKDRLVQNTGIFIVPDHGIDPWQQDYISTVLGWAVWTGKVPQIKPLYDFQIRQAVIRATGPLRSQAIQYGVSPAGATDWASVLTRNGHAPTADGHYPAAFVNGVPMYPAYLRAALKIAVMNGVPGAEAAFAYADAEAKRFNYIPLRWAV